MAKGDLILATAQQWYGFVFTTNEISLVISPKSFRAEFQILLLSFECILKPVPSLWIFESLKASMQVCTLVFCPQTLKSLNPKLLCHWWSCSKDLPCVLSVKVIESSYFASLTQTQMPWVLSSQAQVSRSIFSSCASSNYSFLYLLMMHHDTFTMYAHFGNLHSNCLWHNFNNQLINKQLGWINCS